MRFSSINRCSNLASLLWAQPFDERTHRLKAFGPVGNRFRRRRYELFALWVDRWIQWKILI